ncbi:hypothetical protein GOP47_0013596 [Adiantum capillus-veneris]|uniref:Uncharacterized protein n=1 Tax=Adiantum capillus-veneris TaxID=13818 RepID=A0A9D4UP20_ADICA|nr:hypothetical protein GOP47_0013596 [Adiantum capillus-veneris]
MSRKAGAKQSKTAPLVMPVDLAISSRSRGSKRKVAAMIQAANGRNELLSDGAEEFETDTKVLTLPTMLTLGRIAAIPILIIVFYSNQWWANSAVAGIFVLAALTDWLDGFLARKMKSHSTFGAFLDPVADKLMVATTLVLLSTRPLQASWAMPLPWLIPLPSVAIIGREITMSAVREWAASQSGDISAAVAVNKLGKWKTASQMVALTVLLATNGCQNGIDCLLLAAGVSLLYISAGLALVSLAVYIKGIWGVLVNHKDALSTCVLVYLCYSYLRVDLESIGAEKVDGDKEAGVDKANGNKCAGVKEKVDGGDNFVGAKEKAARDKKGGVKVKKGGALVEEASDEAVDVECIIESESVGDKLVANEGADVEGIAKSGSPRDKLAIDEEKVVEEKDNGAHKSKVGRKGDVKVKKGGALVERLVMRVLM